MADRNVTYKDSIISASLIDDFYNRLNTLRIENGVTPLTIVNSYDKEISPSDIAAVYSAVLSTKDAVSFLKNITLKTNFSDIAAGDIVVAPNSASIIEQNIGQLETACKAYFNTNKSGYNGDVNCVVHNASDNTPNITESICGSNNASFFIIGNSANRSSFATLVRGNSAFHASFNVGFKYAFNADFRTSNSSFWFPHHSSQAGRTCHSNRGYGRCSNGTVVGCNRGKKANHNLPFFAGNNSGFCNGNFASNFSPIHSGNFSGFFSSNFSGNFSGNCTQDNSAVKTAVNSADNSSVWSANNATNYSGVSSVCTVVWGVYTVEGLNDL